AADLGRLLDPTSGEPRPERDLRIGKGDQPPKRRPNESTPPWRRRTTEKPLDQWNTETDHQTRRRRVKDKSANQAAESPLDETPAPWFLHACRGKIFAE